MNTSVAQTAPPPQKTVVIFGASYVKDWPITRIGAAKVINAGVGGDRTEELIARFERDVLARSPDTLLLWGFINDFSRGKAAEARGDAEKIKARYRQMIDLALAKGIKPVVATEVTLPAGATLWAELRATAYRMLGRKGYADRINANVMEVNEWLKQYAKERALPLLDFQAALAPEGFYREREFSQPDASHLSEAAYAALTNLTHSRADLFER